MNETIHLLFVCTGNTCRSPMAEAIAKDLLASRARMDVEVRSAGIGAFDGAPASSGARNAAATAGLDLSSHEATLLQADDVKWADLILTMSPSHLHRVVALGGAEKVAVLPSFVATPDDDLPDAVSDPFGGSEAEYAETFALLKRLVERALDRIESGVNR